jgi:8-oxo-dGTP pyrophosphatase MutT (NUDIX family)
MENYLCQINDLKDKLINSQSESEFLNTNTSDFEFSLGTKINKKSLRPAAILIPLVIIKGQLMIILTRRAIDLKDHPGQIAFPGGKVEKSDTSELAAALREAHEEVGLIPSDVSLLGRLPRHETITGFIVSPFVGIIKNFDNLKPDLNEVAEIFKVPLNFLLDKKNMSVEKKRINGIERGYYVIPYGPYYIWGATARIIKTMVDRLSI